MLRWESDNQAVAQFSTQLQQQVTADPVITSPTDNFFTNQAVLITGTATLQPLLENVAASVYAVRLQTAQGTMTKKLLIE